MRQFIKRISVHRKLKDQSPAGKPHLPESESVSTSSTPNDISLITEAAAKSFAMGDTITIHNFEEKMSKYDVNGSALFALVDMGSNGIRFSISDLSAPSSRLLRCIYKERAGISLYDALHSPTSEAFYFPEQTISEVAKTLNRFRSICTQYGVPDHQISVFATEAMRTAKNQHDMLFAIKESSGLTVDILAPETESLFGAMGARSGFNNVNGLFMDLGGGSVQMTYVNTGVAGYETLAASAAQSLPFGAARLTDALRTQGDDNDIAQELDIKMKATFEGMKSKFKELAKKSEGKNGVDIYFCGGGFRGYGSMLMHEHPLRPYPIQSIGGFTVPGELFKDWKRMLKKNRSDEKIFGLSKRRREQFPAIVMVVKALVEAIPNINSVTFCSGGNREGVLYMKLSSDVRESNPLSMFPGGLSSPQYASSVDALVDVLSAALPPDAKPPHVFKTELLHYIAQNIYVSMGDSSDANSARTLNEPISGAISGLPGLTHQIRAVLALTLCARWGADLSGKDRELYNSLRQFVGDELTWWCDYIGNFGALVARIMPFLPKDEVGLKSVISNVKSHFSHSMGKKGHKMGIEIVLELNKKDYMGLSDEEANKVFKHVGKGTKVDWKLNISVGMLSAL